MGDMILKHGDCRQYMQLLEEESVDFIFADLPYAKTKLKWDKYFPIDDFYKLCMRVLKKDGVVVFTAQQPFTSLIMGNSDWFQLWRQAFVWVKKQGTNPKVCHKRPLSRHEDILLFSPSTNYPYNPVMGTGTSYGGFDSEDGKEVGEACGGGKSQHKENFGTRYPTTVMEFGRDKPLPKEWGKHPTRKPVKLIEYLIRNFSNENAVVLDPTMGSGSTAIACLNTNRNFIGFELNEEYCNLAQKRINHHLNLITNHEPIPNHNTENAQNDGSHI